MFKRMQCLEAQNVAMEITEYVFAFKFYFITPKVENSNQVVA
jgi:hypothetical protein